jgi:hypothetical protein
MVELDLSTQSGRSATADGNPYTSRLLAQLLTFVSTVLAWPVKKLRSRQVT